MAGHVCYHCKRWVEENAAHDCWTTTEAALTRGLPEDLKEAWERLRETAASFGDQRIYASHKSIMFSRKSCYFFVRPRTKHLEVCIFLGRSVESPRVRRIQAASKSKLAHMIHITHRDEVEEPITGWLREAWEFCEAPPPDTRKSHGASRAGSTPAKRSARVIKKPKADGGRRSAT